MEKTKFRAELLPVLEQILGQIPAVAAGKMFGKPGYHVGRKFFAVISNDGIAVKLPRERGEALVGRPEIRPFAPAEGRVMGGWYLITHADPEAYKNEVQLFDEAIAYAASLVQ